MLHSKNTITSPRDEALTPFIDEKGVAVSFNVYIGSGNCPATAKNAKPLYHETLFLNRGASLKDVITRYSADDYEQVQIVWEKPPLTRSSGIFTGGIGSQEVENVCFPIRQTFLYLFPFS